MTTLASVVAAVLIACLVGVLITGAFLRPLAAPQSFTVGSVIALAGGNVLLVLSDGPVPGLVGIGLIAAGLVGLVIARRRAGKPSLDP